MNHLPDVELRSLVDARVGAAGLGGDKLTNLLQYMYHLLVPDVELRSLVGARTGAAGGGGGGGAG